MWDSTRPGGNLDVDLIQADEVGRWAAEADSARNLRFSGEGACGRNLV